MKEIFLSLISKHKDSFSIKSLNTYRGRFLKVIYDYKKYGENPKAFSSWEVKKRKYKNIGSSEDREKDTYISNISSQTHRGVYKIQISLGDEKVCSLEMPPTISKEDVSLITKIINSLSN